MSKFCLILSIAFNYFKMLWNFQRFNLTRILLLAHTKDEAADHTNDFEAINLSRQSSHLAGLVDERYCPRPVH